VTLLLKKYFNTYLLVQIFVKQQRLLEYFNCCVLLLAVAATFVPVEGKQVRFVFLFCLHFVLCFVFLMQWFLDFSADNIQYVA